MQDSRDCLGAGSVVARALPGFQPRPQQLDMAAAVEEAIAEGRHLVVEAGTGVGKSFAYLVPALLHAAREGGPVVVATRTIALQEQLVERDIPFLVDALGLDSVSIALAKGRSNYICLRRLEMAATEGSSLFSDPRQLQQLGRIRDWAHESRDGSLADLPFRPRPEVWDAVCAEAGNCLHKRCPFYEPCAYQASRRRLYRADLIVANHALVFADLALRESGAAILPDHDVVILDEAHELEDGAAEHFGAAVSELAITRQLARFTGAGKRAGLFGRVEVSPELYGEADVVKGAARELFSAARRWRGEQGERRLTAPGEIPDPLGEPLDALCRALRAREDSIESDELRLEWRARTTRLAEIRDALGLILGMFDRELVYWAESAGRRDRVRLRAAPTEVAPLLRRALFTRARCVVMTSATLRVGTSFLHFTRRVGLEDPVTRALGSPFDFEKQCRLLLYPTLPDPKTPGYDAQVAERIGTLVKESGGGAFVLFTSYRSLVDAWDRLAPELERAGLHPMRQGGELNTRAIVSAFEQRPDCVLFATATFWQGIDVRGHHLRLVILARLPFAVPDHPLQQARLERIEDQGGDPFRELSLPQAVLRLRQGFGRLIRTHDDTGTVAILDPRVKTRHYGRLFLESLPRCRVEIRE